MSPLEAQSCYRSYKFSVPTKKYSNFDDCANYGV